MNLKCAGTSFEHFLNIDNVEEALQNSVCYRLKNLSETMQADKSSKKNQVNLIYSQDIVTVSQAHIRLVTLRIFRKEMRNMGVTCENLLGNMETLCLCYGLNTLYDDCNSCFESGYFGQGVNYSKLILEAITVRKDVKEITTPEVEPIHITLD